MSVGENWDGVVPRLTPTDREVAVLPRLHPDLSSRTEVDTITDSVVPGSSSPSPRC